MNVKQLSTFSLYDFLCPYLLLQRPLLAFTIHSTLDQCNPRFGLSKSLIFLLLHLLHRLEEMSKASSSSQHTEKFLIEERESVMVSEKGHSLRKTHFLKPFVASDNGCSGVAELPRERLSVSSSELVKRLPSRDSFSGATFRILARKMEALHEPIWKKAGIFEAIKASTYTITKNLTLICSVAEKWCPGTKSFVFPWGEATITLEDVMVLLGFSVLGSPVFAPLETSETRDSAEKLEKVRLMHYRTAKGCVTQTPWMSSFFGRGGHREHEAFLVMWLSLYVFPAKSRRSISRHVIPMAVRLARGERIALAPAVLASLYRDLDRVSGFGREECDGRVNLKSLFKLVQVWTWERFKDTRPEPREIPKGEPRIAQWDSLQQRSANVRWSFDDFDWRPYTKPLKNWNPLRFYVDEAIWVTVEDSLDDEFASFARCVRVSHLVGDGFAESYYPNRVAMQFGLAQDLPAFVPRHSNFTEKEAWDDYNKPLDGLKLYMPSRLAQGSVTARYKDWWMRSVSEYLSSEDMQIESTKTLNARNTFDDDDDDDDDDVSPKVLPLCHVVEKLEEGFPAKCRRSRMSRLAKKDKTGALVSSSWKMDKTSEGLKNRRSNYQSVQMKRAHEDDDQIYMDEEDEYITIARRICSKKMYDSDAENTGGDAFEQLAKRRRKFQVLDSDDDSGSCQKLASVKLEQKDEDDDETEGTAQKKMQIFDDEVDVNGNTEEEKSMIDDGSKRATCWLHEYEEKDRCFEKRKEDIFERLKQRKIAIKEKELDLEARIMNMEKTLAEIREWKSRGNQMIKNEFGSTLNFTDLKLFKRIDSVWSIKVHSGSIVQDTGCMRQDEEDNSLDIAQIMRQIEEALTKSLLQVKSDGDEGMRQRNEETGSKDYKMKPILQILLLGQWNPVIMSLMYVEPNVEKMTMVDHDIYEPRWCHSWRKGELRKLDPAFKADNNELSPRQKLASGGANGDETSKAYKSMVLSSSDDSNIHISVGYGSIVCFMIMASKAKKL
ncbi:unnamed protein product [Thlaspi arvense]|uniref:Aminotransferase-like plant mobile domain-containing protein n=1 Tax=Thlaspi arvense TaxID=13288 RepID=A0AAU9RBQ0_THLAR|nr:unnamed protein product [Thlaspi arvense]